MSAPAQTSDQDRTIEALVGYFGDAEVLPMSGLETPRGSRYVRHRHGDHAWCVIPCGDVYPVGDRRPEARIPAEEVQTWDLAGSGR